MFRKEAAETRNNRKFTAGRRFHMAPVKSGTLKVFDAESVRPGQAQQPYVGVADFGAMRRGYHLNKI